MSICPKAPSDISSLYQRARPESLVLGVEMPANKRGQRPSLLRRPVFVIGCNRSGTTVFFKTLSSHPTLWSRYNENRDRFLEIFPDDGPDGDLVREATDAQQWAMELFLYREAKNREIAVGIPVLQHLPLKLFQKPVTDLFKSPLLPVVDKTPSNCFRIAMLARVFPSARFIYIVRRGEAVVSSLMEGWKHWSSTDGSWTFGSWHYLRPPGWMEYRDRSLEEICAFQYRSSNVEATNDLESIDERRYLTVRHEDLVTDPPEEYRKIRQFLELEGSTYWDEVVADLDRQVWTRGGSPPQPGKWRRLHGEEVESVRDVIAPVNQRFYDGDEHIDTA